MSIVKRIVSVFLIIILCVGFLPVVGPSTTVSAAGTGWSREAGNPVFINGSLAGDASVIYDADAQLYKMWYTKSPATFSPLDALISNILSRGPTFKTHLLARNFTGIAGDSADVKAIVSYLASLTAPQIKTILLSTQPTIAYATSPNGITWTPQSGGLTSDNNTWNGYGVTSPSVIKTAAGSYEMWYTGLNINENAIVTLFSHLNQLTPTQIATVLDDLLVHKDIALLLNDMIAINITVNAHQISLASQMYTDILTLATASAGSIGHAVSTNGVTWTGQAKVLAPDDTNNYDLFGAYFPSVVKTTAGYEIWYSGLGIDFNQIFTYLQTSGVTVAGLKSALISSTKMTICRATSTNGTTWTKAGTVIVNYAAGTVNLLAAPSVIKLPNGSYEIWYTTGNIAISPILDILTGAGTLNTALADQNIVIDHATSANGINWTIDPAPVITKNGTGWENSAVGFPTVIKDSSAYRMWYTGFSSVPDTMLNQILNGATFANALTGSSTQTAIGLATLSATVVLSSIAITPTTATTNVGSTQTFIARGTYSDSSTATITNQVTWDSSAPLVAYVNSSGVATAYNPGTTNITAALSGIPSNTAVLTVPPISLDFITVTSDNNSVALGLPQQYLATGHYSAGPDVDITDSVIWTSSNPLVANIRADGLASSLSIGTTNIVATSGSIPGQKALSVTAAVITALVISPLNAQAPAGTTIQLKAYEQYTNGVQVDQTVGAAWSSLTTSLANLDTVTPAPGFFKAIAAGTPTIRAIYGGRTATTTLNVTPAVLVSTAITGTAPVPAGTSLQLHLGGTKSDGSASANLTLATSDTTWASLSPANATVSADGLVTGLKKGTTADITASNTGISVKVTISVIDPVLTSVGVNPVNPKLTTGRTLQFTAIGSYSDNSTAALPNSSITWTSTDITKATIDSTGLATAGAIGTPTISAAHVGVAPGTTTLTVTAATLTAITISAPTAGLNLPAGRTTVNPFTAQGLYSDSTTANITTQVTWSSSLTTKATIGASTGLATGIAVGTTDITASFVTAAGTIPSNTLPLNVTAPEVASFTISPLNPSVPKGLTTQFTASGTYSDGSTGTITTLVTWNSGTPAVASIISNTGVATGLIAGSSTIISATITNSLGTLALAVSDKATLSVTNPILQTIIITPANATVAAGLTQDYAAKGTYSDGTTGAPGNLTSTVVWSVTNSAAATFKSSDPAGRLTGLAPGTTNVKATFNSISEQTSLSVGTATLTGLVITPNNPTVALGNSQSFRVVGQYSDGSRVDVTTLAAWTSGTTARADIGLHTGLATTANKTAGTSLITATYGLLSATTNLYVTSASLVSISVTASAYSAVAGRSQQFTATGTYSDLPATIVDLTNYVTWYSSDISTVRINGAGLATTFVPGAANISASLGAIPSPEVPLTVTAKELDSIVVSPSNNPSLTFVSGNAPTLQFTATAVYSDGTTTNVTASAGWASNAGAAAINATTGLATSVAAGTTQITKAWGGKTSTAVTLTVVADTLAPVIELNSPTAGLTQPEKALTVSGRVTGYPAAGSVQVYVNGVASTLTLDGSGNFNQGVLLTTGNNSVYVKCQDAVGNIANTGTRNVVVNIFKPVITLTNPQSGLLTNNLSLTVTGTAAAVDANTVTLRVNGVASSLAVSGGIFTKNITLSEGVNIITVSGYAAGHDNDVDYQGTSGTKTVVLDTQAPVISISSPSNGKFVSTSAVTLAGTVDDPSVTTANLTNNAGSPIFIAISGGSFSQTVSLVPGVNILRVTAADAVGNMTSANNFISVTYDNTKPGVNLDAASQIKFTDSTSKLISGSVDDSTIRTASLIVNNVPLIINGVPTIPVTPSGNTGIFSQSVTLVNGNNTIEVRVTDIAGNTGSTGVVNIIVDTLAPVLTVALSDPLDTINISVTANEDLVAVPLVNVTFAATGATSAVTLTRVDTLKWEGVYTITLGAGDYSVRAEGNDRASNTGVQSVYFNKKTIAVNGTDPTEVTTAGTSLQIETNGAVAGADVSITQTFENPSGNVGQPEGSTQAAGVYIQINASPELRDNLNNIYIQVTYKLADLPAGTDESSLRLYLWDTTMGVWTLVPRSGVNTVDKYIYGTVTHLSQYGGFGHPPPSGGGGQGPAPVTEVTLGGLSSSGLLLVNSSGVAQSSAQLTTADGKVTLGIAAGTTLKTASGTAIGSLNAVVMAQPPQPPAGNALILAYELGPNGTQFTPGITLSFKYDPAVLPAGVSESSLYLAYWDGTQWQKLNSTVDTVNKTVTAVVTHFTGFAILGKIEQPPVTTPPVTTPPVTTPPTTTPPTTTPPTTTPPKTTPPTTAPPTTIPPTTVPPTTLPATTTPPSSGPNVWLIVVVVVVCAAILLTVLIIIKRRNKSQ